MAANLPGVRCAHAAEVFLTWTPVRTALTTTPRPAFRGACHSPERMPTGQSLRLYSTSGSPVPS